MIAGTIRYWRGSARGARRLGAGVFPGGPAGLGRVDAKLGDWVLAGEPVGAMPDIPSPGSGAGTRELDESDPGRRLYYELRRDGRPVDPQPWLASVEDRHDERNGEQKVGQ